MSSACSPASPAASDPERRLRVLVVDDSRVVRRALGRMLAGCPAVARVGSAPTAEDALLLLGPGPFPRFDVLVCDLRLPDMRGVELVGAARERYASAAPAVLVVSAYVDEPDVSAELDALGVAGVFAKPVFGRPLYAALEALRR